LRSQDFASLDIFRRTRDPFRTLVVTVLSQNTTDISALRAYVRLEARVGVTPQTLAKAPRHVIERAIAVGGLQRTKAWALKRLAQRLLRASEDDLANVVTLPLDEARRILMTFPKVGPKTADVLLVTIRGQDTVPVDTHVSRVAQRLGLAPIGGTYEEIRAALQAQFPPADYHDLHLRLIAFGRECCTARRPRCPTCPLRQYCPFPNKTTASERETSG
jgi:endonuclease-3